MPFKSDSQRKLCYLLKGKGEAGSWDCDEWSAATGKKKLPEHVEDQTEKKASGLNDVKALCALWAAPSPIKEAAAKSLLSKLSSVITSPGRGSGDIEESAVDPDPSEGMQKAKPMPARMGHRGGNKFVSPKGAARTALMQATKRVFGEDLNNRGIKTAGRFGVFPNIGKPRKEASQGASTATPKVDSASSAGLTPAAPAAPAPSAQPPAVPVNKNPTPNASSALPSPADTIQPAVTPATKPAVTPATKPADSGSWFTPADKTKQTAQATSAAAGTVGTAFSAAMGNQDSLQTLNNDANRTNWSDIGSKWDAFKSKTTDSLNKYVAGEPSLPKHKDETPWDYTKRYAGETKAKYDRAKFLNNAKSLGEGFTGTFGLNTLKPVTRAISSKFNDYTANSEGRRVAAGYALPAVNWMNSNPWAKYLGGAALGGLGLYGINKLMGGGNKNKGTGSALDQNFQQGLASQQPRR